MLGKGTRLLSHVTVEGWTQIGERCELHPFVSIGGPPQHLGYKGEPTKVIIGDDNIFREYVTVNRATVQGGGITSIGNKNFLMAYVHVAHDCRLGSHLIMANAASLAGHITIGDHAIIGGLTGIHQFVRIGAYGFVGGMSGVEKDVIPFGMVLGNRAYLSGLNIVGLKRHGFPRDQIHELRQAYRMLFSSEGTLMERLEDVENMFASNPLVRQITEFIKSHSDRSFCVPNNNVPAPSQS